MDRYELACNILMEFSILEEARNPQGSEFHKRAYDILVSNGYNTGMNEKKNAALVRYAKGKLSAGDVITLLREAYVESSHAFPGEQSKVFQEMATQLDLKYIDALNMRGFKESILRMSGA